MISWRNCSCRPTVVSTKCSMATIILVLWFCSVTGEIRRPWWLNTWRKLTSRMNTTKRKNNRENALPSKKKNVLLKKTALSRHWESSKMRWWSCGHCLMLGMLSAKMKRDDLCSGRKMGASSYSTRMLTQLSGIQWHWCFTREGPWISWMLQLWGIRRPLITSIRYKGQR